MTVAITSDTAASAFFEDAVMHKEAVKDTSDLEYRLTKEKTRVFFKMGDSDYYSLRDYVYAAYAKGIDNFYIRHTLLYAGRVYDEKEMCLLVDSTLDFWLTAGRFASKFEKKFAEFLGIKHCLLTNSGSSANLLAISALTSPSLKERQLKPGDEVITTACGFPTTLNPIIQNNLVPVFIDIELGTYNIDVEKIVNAISKKTKAIFIPPYIRQSSRFR